MSEKGDGMIGTVMASTGQLDQYLDPCQQCGGQLRAEMKIEWRPIAEVCSAYDCTPEQLISMGVQADAFGRVKSGVPYVTCMHCGMHADASAPPPDQGKS